MKSIAQIARALVEEDVRRLEELTAAFTSTRDAIPGDGTPDSDTVFEIVIPCSDPAHVEVRNRREGNDLKLFIEEAIANWNERNPKNKISGNAFHRVYVFLVLGERSVAIPGKSVEEITGVQTRDYDGRGEERLKFHTVSSARKGWV